MKSIHERVRAAIERKERQAKKQADRAHDARMARLERRDAKLDAELERRLQNGDYDEFDFL